MSEPTEPRLRRGAPVPENDESVDPASTSSSAQHFALPPARHRVSEATRRAFTAVLQKARYARGRWQRLLDADDRYFIKFGVLCGFVLVVFAVHVLVSFPGSSGRPTLWVVERLLAVTNLAAFASVWVQAAPLLSRAGLHPVREYMTRVRRHCAMEELRGMGRGQADVTKDSWQRRVNVWVTRLKSFPCVFWLCDDDWFIQAVCAAGFVSSLILLVYGAFPFSLLWFATFVCYMSIVEVAGPFLGLQMHANVVESNFLAAISGPWRDTFPALQLFVHRWNLFRVMLGCGLCKWYGSSCWKDLTGIDASPAALLLAYSNCSVVGHFFFYLL
eukprot:339404_1